MYLTLRQFVVLLEQISTILELESGDNSTKPKQNAIEMTHERALKFMKGK